MDLNCSPFSFLLILILMSFSIYLSSSSSVQPTCNGSIADCNFEEYETLMDSEISRRFLEQKKYISPGALKRDQPVCNGGANGQSYSSSCLPPSSNPQNRGCPRYYRCRSDS
ncbi:hypothetical protein JCGZ_13152 [Jatropha curcas]|uniref:Uncharacterized protein n=1 Tax=Jatropha curcas TaxID=180498 RepID=A0A067K901_JATCU|nr:hypothetical protein JCGZ_13152 [Jatropha curcas]